MTTLPLFPIDGGCLCGAVRYTLMTSPKAVYACHCRDCQKVGSGPYAIGIIVDQPQVRTESVDLLTRTDRVAESGNLVPQYACVRCGTRMWHQPPKSPSMLIVRAGTLDDPSWARPVVHTWTRGRLPWVDIGGELQFEGPLPSREILYSAWQDYVADCRS
jgi:hypothetical protein